MSKSIKFWTALVALFAISASPLYAQTHTPSDSLSLPEYREREALDLVEEVALHPVDAPFIDVPLAVVLMRDALHGVVVVHPGLRDIVAHGLADGRGRNLQHLRQVRGGGGVKPHEDRHAVHGLTLQGSLHALLRVHTDSII